MKKQMKDLFEISISEIKDDYNEIVNIAQQTGITPETMLLYLTYRQITILNAQIYNCFYK